MAKSKSTTADDIKRVATLAVQALGQMADLREAAEYAAAQTDEELRGTDNAEFLRIAIDKTRSRVAKFATTLAEAIRLERSLRDVQRSEYGTRLQFDGDGAYQPGDWGKVRECWWLDSATAAVISYGAELWDYMNVDAALRAPASELMAMLRGEKVGGVVRLEPKHILTTINERPLVVPDDWPGSPWIWRSWGRGVAVFPCLANTAEVKQYIRDEERLALQTAGGPPQPTSAAAVKPPRKAKRGKPGRKPETERDANWLAEFDRLLAEGTIKGVTEFAKLKSVHRTTATKAIARAREAANGVKKSKRP